MGLQVIFVVETNSKCMSDWIYIKNTINRFYNYDGNNVKLSPIYMNGKGNYKTTKIKKEIGVYISQYTSCSKEHQSKVIYCFDCDDYDFKPEDSKFLEEARDYCNTQGYDFVWFCKDIECVYLGNRIDRKEKKSQSTAFQRRKGINQVDFKKLQGERYQNNTSNILNVLDQYLVRKEEYRNKF